MCKGRCSHNYRYTSIAICLFWASLCVCFTICVFLVDSDLVPIIYDINIPAHTAQGHIISLTTIIVIAVADVFLAVGIIMMIAWPMTVWLCINTLLWLIHAGLFISSACRALLGTNESKLMANVRNELLFLSQVLWMIMLCEVGNYWHMVLIKKIALNTDIVDAYSPRVMATYYRLFEDKRPYSIFWNTSRIIRD